MDRKATGWSSREHTGGLGYDICGHRDRWRAFLHPSGGQVELDKNDKEKMAFCTQEGLFEFNVLPFGLCNGLVTFQWLMDLVLTGLQWSSCSVYLDDVVVVGRQFKEHLLNLQNVFEHLRRTRLRLKPKKCRKKYCTLDILYLMRAFRWTPAKLTK